MSPGREPTVSVVVPVHDGAARLPELLVRLCAQTLPRERFEVIVVDDASTDGTARVAERSGGARVVRIPRRGGAYAARNAGVREARGSVVALTDADCRPEPDWLERGLDDLERFGADVLGGRVELPLGELPTVAQLVDWTRFDQERSVTEWGYATTANMLVRRDVLDRIGGFNDRLVSSGDAELSHRASAAGYRLAYSPRATVVHEPRRRAREVARKGFRLGYGFAQLAVHGEGPLRARPQPRSRLRSYLPRRGLVSGARLAAAGYRPSRGDRARLVLAQWAFFDLPIVAGNLAGALRSGRGYEHER